MSLDILTPGEAIKRALEQRNWTQNDLAIVLGKHQPYINEIIQGKRSITPEMAVSLAAALGNTAEFWLNLDAKHRLSQLEPKTEIERRARLFNLAPIKDMEKRGWIRPADTPDQLERAVCAFFNIESLDQEIRIHAHARQPFKTTALEPSQIAWCVRAGKMASVLQAASFNNSDLSAALPELKLLADFPEKARHIPKVLAKVGVRLVVVEPLPHSPIDGAAFWLADDAPVVAISARYDRIDCFWFTLAHELDHITHRDAQSVDSDLLGESAATDLEAIERRANEGAAAFLIPPDKLKSFIIRVKPFYSKERIVQFAQRMKVHPGIVCGQLQYHREIGWHANREMLAKIRSHITSTALTDGWGASVPAI